MRPVDPSTRDIVLIGGGHAHALVLRRWAMRPLDAVRLTVINPGPTAPYSGMLPGFVAGHYRQGDLDIDLTRLARAAGARIIIGAATGIDRDARTITVPGQPPIGYAVASINVGITTDMPTLPGFSDHAIPAKPLGRFASGWADYLDGTPNGAAIIGAGVAGAELAMAMAHALRTRGHTTPVTLIDRSDALAEVAPKTRAKLITALADMGVTLLQRTTITHLTENTVHLADGRCIVAGFITGAAQPKPPEWLADTGLGLHNGFLTVGPTLQTSDPAIFAAGDCAHMTHAPRPKAGVYAVRQAPILHHNLQAKISGAPLRDYHPQRGYLKLISLGGKRALAEKAGLTLTGALMWRWKNRIDQNFMRKLQ